MIALLSGLFHDVGKSTGYFQEYLSGNGKKSNLTSHAPIGAVLAWYLTGFLDLPEEIRSRVRLGTFLSVLRHHGRLRCSWTDELSCMRLEAKQPDSFLVKQMENIDLDGIVDWTGAIAPSFGISLKVAGVKLNSSSVIEALAGIDSNPLRLGKPYYELDHAVGFMASFGSVLSVDKIDAALEGRHLPRLPLPEDCVSKFKRDCLDSSGCGLNVRRRKIASGVVSTLLRFADQPLFTLTAPTGSGKTLTAAEAAFALRNKIERETGKLARIVYCLPFTTVIDQNYGVFAQVLKHSNIQVSQDILLKHHHLTEAFYRTSENAEYEPDGAGELLTETWQSEMVVTTFYQLLHSMLSPLNREIKRAGQLVDSIVLMDEVQAIPLKYWKALRNLFMSMARVLSTKFILLTATRPLIFRSGDAVELLPEHEKHFKAMSRTRLICRHASLTNMENFMAALSKEIREHGGSILIVLNRRKTVRELYHALKSALPERFYFTLSMDLTPKDRRERIKEIQESLNRKENPVVISTQLVEAGVDISFPVVYRDLAPLDSIIQSAGRCNRSGEGSEGRVYLWNLADNNGHPQWQRVYDKTLIDATRDVLSNETEYSESDYLQLSQRYFEACWNRSDQEPVEEFLARGDFEKLAEFKLIEDGPPIRSFFIIRDKEDQELWNRYRATRQLSSPGEAVKRFRIFKRDFFERVIQVTGKPDSNEPIEPLMAGKENYDPETGFVLAPSDPCTTII